MTPQTQANCICQTTTSKVKVSRLAFAGLPSPSLPCNDPGFILTCWHRTREEIVCDVFWFYGCVWSPPYAKCIVCEDMQVARCLCNFPPAPFERWARCNNNNNKPVWLLKLNSAWLQFQRFFPWPEGPCYSVWARVWTARTSWPLDRTWLAGPQGR